PATRETSSEKTSAPLRSRLVRHNEPRPQGSGRWPLTAASALLLLAVAADRPGHHPELDHAALLLLLQVRPALLDVDVVPRQPLGDRPLPGAVEVHINPQVAERLPPQFRLEALLPPIEPCPAPPRLVEPRGHLPVAAGEDPFEQAGLDVVLLDPHELVALAAVQVVAGPAEVVSRLHPVPLVGRVRLGHEVRHAGRHL